MRNENAENFKWRNQFLLCKYLHDFSSSHTRNSATMFVHMPMALMMILVMSCLLAHAIFIERNFNIKNFSFIFLCSRSFSQVSIFRRCFTFSSKSILRGWIGSLSILTNASDEWWMEHSEPSSGGQPSINNKQETLWSKLKEFLFSGENQARHDGLDSYLKPLPTTLHGCG